VTLEIWGERAEEFLVGPTFSRAAAIVSVVVALFVGAAAAHAATADTPAHPANGSAGAFVAAASMTAEAKAIYLATRPKIDDRSAFATDCPTPDARDAFVLGCFTEDPARIYILRPSDDDLRAAMTVTAAYETLHAAYAHLDPDTRAAVDKALTDAFTNSRDPRIRDLAAQYDKSTNNERLDALHSLFGTQVTKLPAGLERYYARYFRDRQTVVRSFLSYEVSFDDRDGTIDRMASEIAGMKSQAATLQQQYDTSGATADRLTAQIADLRAHNQVAASDTLVAQQNGAVDQANAAGRQLAALVAQANGEIAQYNQSVLIDQDRITPLDPVTVGSS
jgi:hypothetical protein